jgi:hypothetical protein
MSKKINILVLILVLIVIASCSSAGEQGGEPMKTIAVEEFDFSFMVSEACFEGPLPGDCKQHPPEERPEECLCFVDTTNPQMVNYQKFDLTGENTRMASISIISPDTPAFSPGEDDDLVQFIKQEWSYLDLEDLPETPNLDLDGVPAVSLLIPPTQGGAASQEVFFIKDARLFNISMLSNLDPVNAQLYEDFLDTFVIEK